MKKVTPHTGRGLKLPDSIKNGGQPLVTLQILSQHFRLRERLARDEQTLESLKAAVSPGGQVLTGMPHSTGVRDKVGDLAIEIADMQANVQKIKEKVAREEIKVNRFIETVEDEQIRTILRLRYLRCLTWNQVALVIGGRNTADGVKSTCYRFMASQSCTAPTAVTLDIPPINDI